MTTIHTDGDRGMNIFLLNGKFGYFKDIITREKKVLSPLHLTEKCFVPRRLVSLDISALIKKAYHSGHLYVFRRAVASPKMECCHLFSF